MGLLTWIGVVVIARRLAGPYWAVAVSCVAGISLVAVQLCLMRGAVHPVPQSLSPSSIVATACVFGVAGGVAMGATVLGVAHGTVRLRSTFPMKGGESGRQ
jgi:hypothetical protein